MATTADIGHGSTFERSSDGTVGGVFAAVLAEVTSITPPKISRDTIDMTHMGSTQRWRDFVGGLKDGGEVTIEGNFEPDNANVAAALSDINTNTAGYYKITFPDGTAWGFAAFATGYEPGVPVDDKMTISLSYKLTGKPTFVA